MDERYWDEFGLLHPKRNERSENGILFLAEYYLLLEELGTDVIPPVGQLQDFIRYEKYSKMSHDCYTGAMAYLHKHKDTAFGKNMIDRAEIFSKDRPHPRDIIYYGWIKFPWLFVWFLPLLCLMMIGSCIRTYKRRPHGTFIATDTKLLVWCRCKGSNMKITWAICSWIIKNKKEFGSWAKVFEIYFGEPDHPNRLLAKELGE